MWIGSRFLLLRNILSFRNILTNFFVYELLLFLIKKHQNNPKTHSTKIVVNNEFFNACKSEESYILLTMQLQTIENYNWNTSRMYISQNKDFFVLWSP